LVRVFMGSLRDKEVVGGICNVRFHCASCKHVVLRLGLSIEGAG
jgi:hypothetical protein